MIDFIWMGLVKLRGTLSKREFQHKQLFRGARFALHLLDSEEAQKSI